MGWSDPVVLSRLGHIAIDIQITNNVVERWRWVPTYSCRESIIFWSDILVLQVVRERSFVNITSWLAASNRCEPFPGRNYHDPLVGRGRWGINRQAPSRTVTGPTWFITGPRTVEHELFPVKPPLRVGRWGSTSCGRLGLW
jgi:hypothetical protein